MTTAPPPPHPPRLVQWKGFEILLSGERLATLAGQEITRRNAPVDRLEITFANDLLRFEGRIRKTIGIPFTIDIDRFTPNGTSVDIHLARASAFGIPLPSFIMTLAQLWLPPGDVSYDAHERVVSLKLDRFLPPFADVEIVDIRPVTGGITVRFGAGGADLPDASGGIHGEHNT